MEQHTEQETSNWNELVKAAVQTFDRGDLFTYVHNEVHYTLPFSAALQICRRHIERVSVGTVVGMLHGMRAETERLSAEAQGEALSRGQQLLAKKAMDAARE